MVVGDKCPKCEAFTLIWEHEYNRWTCLKLDCGYVKYKDDKKIIDLEVEKENDV